MKKLTVTRKVSPNCVWAIGDVHGRLDLFRDMMEKLRGSNATVIQCGDLIDRGPNDLGVLEFAQELMQDPESWGLHSFHVLMGNHEHMFLDAVDGIDVGLWVSNGGDLENLDKLAEHAPWIRELPYYMTVGDTIFCHAGTLPGKNPAESMNSLRDRDDFVWQRKTVKSGPKLGKWTDRYEKVVFGHTPLFVDGCLIPEPYTVGDGICIDSGGVYTGVLTAYNASKNCYLQVSD